MFNLLSKVLQYNQNQSVCMPNYMKEEVRKPKSERKQDSFTLKLCLFTVFFTWFNSKLK